MARRKKVLGLPIGKKKALIGGKALLAGAGLAAAIPAAVGASRRLGEAASRGMKTAREIEDVGHTASSIKEAVSSHSSTLGKVGAIVSEVRKIGGGGESTPKLSHLIEEHIDIAVPRQAAYNQWTQFEMFPSIVKGAERVEQQERDKTGWTSKIGPSRRTWTGEITEQVPDERIAWKSTGGLTMKGVVTFHSLDDDLTRTLVQIEYRPHGAVESVGNLLRIQRRRVRRDLRLFKHFIELRGEETGAWRSRIAKKDEGNEDSDDSGERRGSRGRRGANGSSPSRKRTTASRGSRSKASPSRRAGASGSSRKS